MNRINYGEALRRRWWLLVVLGLVGLVGGLLVPLSHAKSSTQKSWATSALVGSVPSSGRSTVLGSGVSLQDILFYAKTGSIVAAAAHSVGIDKSAPELENKIKVSLPSVGSRASQNQPGVVKLTTVASSPALSARFTNAFGAQLGDYLENQAKQTQLEQAHRDQARAAAIQTEMTALGGPKKEPAMAGEVNSLNAQVTALEYSTPSTGYQVLQPAVAGSAKDVTKGGSGLHSSHVLYGALGLLGGLLIGFIIIAAAELMDESLRTAAGAADAFGYPVAAEIPEPDASGRSALGNATATDPHAEAYRKLRMSVLLENLAGQTPTRAERRTPLDTGPRREIVLVLSPSDEPSRSAVVDNLAAACAEAGQRVIVVNALDAAPDGQDAESTTNRQPDIDDVDRKLEPSRLKNVALLKLSQLIGNSSQLLARAPAVFDAARTLADIAIVEAPPLLAFHDGEALASIADVVLVVGESGRTQSGQARRTGELLRRFDAPVLGVVFTGVRLSVSDLRQAERTRGPSSRPSQLEPSSASWTPASVQAEG